MRTGREPADRDVATAATTAILRVAGAAVLRVHDVAINRDALAIADAMIAETELSILIPKPDKTGEALDACIRSG
jgi:dihydropteroate synthase